MKKLIVISIFYAALFVFIFTQQASASTNYVNDTSASVAYTGTWSTFNTTSTPELYRAYNNDGHSSTSANSYVSYTFTGNSISWIGALGTDLGKADVYIDDVLDKTVDLYIPLPSAGEVYKRAVYIKNGLTDGSHTIKVVVTGTKNANSSATKIIIDSFEVRTTNLANNATVTTSSSVNGWGWFDPNLTDGETNSIPSSMGWSSNDNLTSNHSEWAQIDLGYTNYIDRIDLYPRNDAGGIGAYYPVDFHIQISKDNIVWTTVVSETNVSQPGDSAQSYRIAAQNARYIKVTGTSLRQNAQEYDYYRMQLAEIEVHYDQFKHSGSTNATMNATYYISSSSGNDTNDGLSQSTAWKTLTRASQMIYSAGNSIMLKSGDTWSGETFFPHGNGTAISPILITSYGSGNKPIIQAGAGAAYGIRIVDAHGYKITNLEFSNSVAGIMVVTDLTYGHDYLWIENCYFHDNSGTSIGTDLLMPYPENYFGAGIAIISWADSSSSRSTSYSNITIQNNSFYQNDTGIMNLLRDKPMNLDGHPTNAWYFPRNALSNVNIIDNTISRSYRSGGIMLYGVTGGAIDNAVIDETGYQKGMFWGVAAAQVTYSQDYTVKNSEFKNTYRTNNSPDGEGFNFESGNINLTLSNTKIHGNEGPAVLFYGQNGGWYGDNVNNVMEGNEFYNNGVEGTNDHSRAFKNYPNNTGLMMNNKLTLKFDAQCICTDPLTYSGTNYVYDPDGSQISGPGLSVVNDNDAAITYSGTWSTLSNASYLNSDAHSTTSSGAYGQLKFWGQTMNVIGVRSSDLGKIDMYIDDVYDSTVDLYNATTQYNQVIYTKTGLSSGIHTIKWVFNNQYNASVTGNNGIIIDAFDYYDAVTPPTTAPVNLAEQATVTASSDVNGYGWLLSNVKDGEKSSQKATTSGGITTYYYGWSSTNSLSTNHTEWLQFDLGSLKSFNEVDLYTLDTEIGVYFPVDFNISVSNDAVNWTTVITKSNYPKPTTNKQRFILASTQNARYVRITGTSLRINPNESNSYRMQFAEVAIVNNNMVFSGTSWTAGADKYEQSLSIGDYIATRDAATYTDQDSTVIFKINATGDTDNWAGMNVRKTSISSASFSDGYLIYMRADGSLYVYKGTGVTIAGPISTGLNPTANPVKLRVVTSGTNIKVYVNDAATPSINVTDSTYTSGYIGLATHNLSAVFSSFTPVNYTFNSGSWSGSVDTFNQTVNNVDTSATSSSASYSNPDMTATILINNTGNINNWAGINFRKSSLTTQGWADGYLVYMRSDGTLVLYKASEMTTIQSVSTGLDPTTNPVKIRIIASGSSIKVYLNQSVTPSIDVTDTTYTSGYSGLATSNANTTFTNVYPN